MKGQFARLILFMTVCVLLIAGITAATFAVWTTSDGGSTPATTVTGEWDDPSFRYLTLELTHAGGTTVAVYRQNADDGSAFDAFDAGDVDAAAVTSAKVIGYDGILTVLKIPPTVTVKGGGNTAEVTVNSIAMGTVEQYDALRLVEELEIPATVNSIASYSFAFCDSLEKVVFVGGGGELTLGDKCFYRCVKLDKAAGVNFGGRTVTEGEYCFG